MTRLPLTILPGNGCDGGADAINDDIARRTSSFASAGQAAATSTTRTPKAERMVTPLSIHLGIDGSVGGSAAFCNFADGPYTRDQSQNEKHPVHGVQGRAGRFGRAKDRKRQVERHGSADHSGYFRIVHFPLRKARASGTRTSQPGLGNKESMRFWGALLPPPEAGAACATASGTPGLDHADHLPKKLEHAGKHGGVTGPHHDRGGSGQRTLVPPGAGLVHAPPLGSSGFCWAAVANTRDRRLITARPPRHREGR